MGLTAFLVLGTPAAASWWWPTQGTWLETDHVTPDDADEDGEMGLPSHWGILFGSALAIDEDMMVVGTQFDSHSDGWGTASGDGGDWAYVFERGSRGEWNQVAKLVPDDAREGDTFAWSLDIDAESGVVVAGNPVTGDPDFGKIYIFEEAVNGSWSQTASFTPPPNATKIYGSYGNSIAVSGHTVVTSWLPNVYLYQKTADGWTRGETLNGSYVVDIQDGTLVTSRFKQIHDEYAVYRVQEGEWTETARLDPASRVGDPAVGNTDSAVGCRIQLNEDATTLVIGACIDERVYGLPGEYRASVEGVGNVSADTAAMGSVWVYDFVDGEWRFTADIPNPDPRPERADWFGFSIDAHGDQIVVGAPFDDENGGRDGDGAAYIYEKIQGDWHLVSKLRNHDNGPYMGKDVFGNAVGISGDTVAVGAPFDDQRRDGTPPPIDDSGVVPPCPVEDVPWECYPGMNAGSVYVFENLDPAGPSEESGLSAGSS